MKRILIITVSGLILFLYSQATFAQFSEEKLEDFYIEDFQETLDEYLKMYVPMANTADFQTFLQFEDASYPDDFSLTMKMSPLEKSENIFQKTLVAKVATGSEVLEEKQVINKDSELNDYLMSNLHPNRVISIYFEDDAFNVIVYQLKFSKE